MINATNIIRTAHLQGQDAAIKALIAASEMFVAGEAALVRSLADQMDLTRPIDRQIGQIMSYDLEQEDGVMDLTDLVTDIDSDERFYLLLSSVTIAARDLAIHPVVKSYFMVALGHLVSFLTGHGPRGAGDWMNVDIQNDFAIDKFDYLSWHVGKMCSVYYAARVKEALKVK